MDELLNDFNPTFEALSIIYESMESDTDTFKSFVTTGLLMESGYSKDIVMESAGDIFKTIAAGIRKFITKVKEFFKKILLYITSSSQDLNKLADEVKKVIKDKEINFTVDGYDYTVMGKPNPNMSEFQSIVNDYNNDMSNIKDLKLKDIKQDITDWLDEKHLNSLRGSVLGTNKEIPEEDYLQTVRNFYRNDEESTHKIEVTKSYVETIINKSKKIEEEKKASIKDRDKLLELLTKTEKFFGRTIYVHYSGETKKMDVDKVSIDDNKFSKESNKVDATDDTIKVVTTYASYKSKQVNKIASMINLVMCEKVNALKDQISQERNILKKCLFGNTNTPDTKKDSVKESMELNPDTDIKVTQYDIFAMESMILEHRYYDELYRSTLLEEAQFIVESLQNNEIASIMEADTTKLGGKLKQAISDIIDRIVKAFRQKAIGNTEKYGPWIEDIKEGIQEKAKNKKEFTMASFDDANYAKMVRDMQSAISEAYQSKDYNSAKFATRINTAIDSMEKVKDTNTSKMLINYFRTGSADEELKRKTINGNQLAGKVGAMMDYISNYGTTVTKPTEQLSKAIDTSSKAFKTEEEKVGESTYLSLLGCPICESDLVLCRDYNMVMEKTNIGGNEKKVLSGDVKNAVDSSKKAVQNETQNGTEVVKTVTGVASKDKEGTGTNPDGTEGKKTNTKATTYKNIVDNFFKRCISLYLKAREEHFLAYVHALADIDGVPPKFDENGKYIPKANRKKTTEEK